MSTELESQVLPIAKYMIDCMIEDPSGLERFAFADHAANVLATGLDALFALEIDPGPTLDELVRFSCALELALRSPSAAAMLRAVMYADPRVMEVLGGREREATGAREMFGGHVLRAPMFGQESANGTVKASSFVTPGAQLRPARNGCVAPVREAKPAVKAASAPAPKRRQVQVG